MGLGKLVAQDVGMNFAKRKLLMEGKEDAQRLLAKYGLEKLLDVS